MELKRILNRRAGEKAVKSSTPRTHPGILSLLLTLLALAIAAAANLAVGALPATLTKLDATAGGLYTLSPEGRDALAALEEDVTVFVLAQSGQGDAALDEFLVRFAGESPHINLEYRDPVLHPYFSLEYTSLTLSDNSLIIVGARRSTVIDFTELYTAEYSDEGEVFYSFQAESRLVSALNYVNREDLPRLYLLQGHGEAQPADAARELAAREGFVFDSLNLLTVESVPADAGAVLVCSPAADLAVQEAGILLDYLEGGGKLLVWTNPEGEEMPHLAEILARWGLSAVEGIVVEGDAGQHVSGYPYYLLPTLSQHPVTTPLLTGGYPALTPLAHGIAIEAQPREGMTVLPLLTSSGSAYLKADASGAESLDREAGDASGPFVLGAAAESAESGARLIWYATGLLLDETADAMVSGANTMLLLSSLDWLAGQEGESTAISPKTLNAPPLVMSAAQAGLWKLLLAGLLPAGTLGAGLWVRSARRRH